MLSKSQFLSESPDILRGLWEKKVKEQGWKLKKNTAMFHNEMQTFCSEKQGAQILTTHVHNGRIAMHVEVSNEIGVFHWNATHDVGWNSSQVVLL